MDRRTFMAGLTAAATARAVPKIAQSAKSKRILTLVYDKSLGMMRAIDKVVR